MQLLKLTLKNNISFTLLYINTNLFIECVLILNGGILTDLQQCCGICFLVSATTAKVPFSHAGGVPVKSLHFIPVPCLSRFCVGREAAWEPCI